jgi:hypothetical protein
MPIGKDSIVNLQLIIGASFVAKVFQKDWIFQKIATLITIFQKAITKIVQGTKNISKDKHAPISAGPHFPGKVEKKDNN